MGALESLADGDDAGPGRSVRVMLESAAEVRPATPGPAQAGHGVSAPSVHRLPAASCRPRADASTPAGRDMIQSVLLVPEYWARMGRHLATVPAPCTC